MAGSYRSESTEIRNVLILQKIFDKEKLLSSQGKVYARNVEFRFLFQVMKEPMLLCDVNYFVFHVF